MQKRYYKKTDSEIEIERKTKQEGMVQCEYCGRKLYIPAYMDNSLCSWCHRTVWNNTKNHFMYKMKKLLEKKEGKENE